MMQLLWIFHCSLGSVLSRGWWIMKVSAMLLMYLYMCAPQEWFVTAANEFHSSLNFCSVLFKTLIISGIAVIHSHLSNLLKWDVQVLPVVSALLSLPRSSSVSISWYFSRACFTQTARSQSLTVDYTVCLILHADVLSCKNSQLNSNI